MLKKPNSQTLALNSLGLNTDNDALIIESDNVVFATSAAMSDTEDLQICFATTSLLNSLNDLSIDVLDIPVLDTDLLHLARMVDQVAELVCDVLVLPCTCLSMYLTLTDGILLAILQRNRLEGLIGVALVEGIHIFQRCWDSGIHRFRLRETAALDFVAAAAGILVGLFQKVGVFLIG